MNVYMELTNPIHGGEGWELGEVLWSPVGTAWNSIMTKPKEGDLIIHSVKQRTPIVNHKLWGYSYVSERAIITEEKPPIPDRWENYDEYYVIPLTDYTPLDKKIYTQEFLNDYADKLRSLIKVRHQFYSSTYPPKIVQAYLTVVPHPVKDMIEEYLETELSGPKNASITRVSQEENISSTDGNGKPSKINTVVERIVRNTKIIKELKQQIDNRCQVCGLRITLNKKKFYSEGHHLKKLGSIHQGPDIVGNIMILCPNHHVEFDFGSIAIDPETMKLIHIDSSSSINNQPLAYNRDNLDLRYIKYHYDYLYKGEK